MRFLVAALALIMTSCGSQYYYVVRHAEKSVVTKDSMMFSSANPPLSDAGQVRAFVLRDELKDKNISHIFSTNYVRTVSTAKPLAETRSLPVQLYSPAKDSLQSFINKLKSIEEKNILVVGHSNTVDDIVNALTGEKNIPGDLNESVYDNMYIIKRKGDKFIFSQKKYGYPSNPE